MSGNRQIIINQLVMYTYEVNFKKLVKREDYPYALTRGDHYIVVKCDSPYICPVGEGMIMLSVNMKWITIAEVISIRTI